MDAVSQVLLARQGPDDAVSRMLGASIIGHAALFVAIVLAPAAWLGARAVEPESIMTVSLAGSEGPDTGGRAQEGNRPVQVAAPPAARPEPVAPPAARTPEMTEPTKDLPKRVPPKIEQPAPERTTRTTPTTGAQVRPGDAVAETNIRGGGFGLSSGGGGLGAQVDNIGDFCCPQYLVAMQSRIRERWEGRQQTLGATVLRFVIQRDGALADVLVERSSGNATLDLIATRAVRLAQLPPLPAEYPNPSLAVHLTFEYQR